MYVSEHQSLEHITTPEAVFTAQIYADPENREWLDNAIALNSALISAAPEIRALADYILPELLDTIQAEGILKKTHTTLGKSRIKEAVKMVLLNCYVAYLLGLPARYSRDTHYYSKPRRYGQLFFKYDRIMAVVSALESRGYICQKKGFFNKETGVGRQSRIWASEKLISLFEKFLLSNFQIIAREKRTELIELRDKKKNPINYKETGRTRKMRKNLLSYNNFTNLSDITIQLNRNTPVNLHTLCKKILYSALTGDITITNITVNQSKVANLANHNSTTNNINNNTYLSYSMTHNFFQYSQEPRGLQTEKTYNFESITTANSTGEIQSDPNICLAILSLITKKYLFFNRTKKGQTEISRKELIRRRNAVKHPLNYFGIEQIEFTVNTKSLHRVFNQGEFTSGGRFYGAYHETISKKIRSCIKINGQDTVELDYSAHHLRMPYHLLGIDYQDDPYQVLAADEKERKIYKKLCLIAINAGTEIKAIRGFRKAAKGEGFDVAMTDETIRSLLTWMKMVHHPIAEYIHSEKGRKLQFLDSKITEKILMSMMKQGIPCLPVHDSYIVPAQYEQQLQEAMEVEYEKMMGFEPVIG